MKLPDEIPEYERDDGSEDHRRVDPVHYSPVPREQMSEILKLPGVKLLNQTNDLAAKQEREKGFCECIIVSEEKSVLQNALIRFEKLFPEDAIILQAKKLINRT